MFHILIPM